MKYNFHSSLVLSILQIEWCTSQNRYCQEAVDSVTIVDSCPTSKTEWDVAARKKNCDRVASQQNCTTVEQFQYHCVINGLRNKLLEVCGPRRVIFGHCVEFNVHGGVIQDHLSAPCNATFPKCDPFYYSSEVYKYPDCYLLVSNSDNIHVSRTTATESTHTDQVNVSISTTTEPTPTNIPISIFIILVVAFTPIIIFGIICCFCFEILYSKPEKRTNLGRKTASRLKNKPQIIETKTTESGRVMANPVKQNHKEDASRAKFDDMGVLQPESNFTDRTKYVSGAKSDDRDVLQPGSDHKEDTSEAQSDCPGVLQPDSNSLCNSEASAGIISIISVAPSSSASSYYEYQDDHELVRRFPVKEDETRL